MRFLFLMDPIEYINIFTDTTLLLLIESKKRGHSVWMADADDISFNNGRLIVEARTGLISKKKNHWQFRKKSIIPMEDFDAIIIRKDPPFNDIYLNMTRLLDLIRDKVFIINDTHGLQKAGEKLYTLNFKELMPPVCVTAKLDVITEFISKYGDTVIKPLDGFGGSGVMLLKKNDPNIRSIYETLTDNGRISIMCQKYLPEIKYGDYRVMLLDGEIIGAVRRMPQQNELRANIHSGGKPKKAVINKRIKQIVEKIKPKLTEDGLYLVGLDIIGDYLTEINVTSPTCVQEMHRTGYKNLDKLIIDFIERKVKDF